MLLIDILSFSCPLILCAMGALYSEYAGILAIFLEGLVTFSAFLMFSFSMMTGFALWGSALTATACVTCVIFFAFLIEKLKANPFIAATAINLLFASLPSLFSTIQFKTRGVLSSPDFYFPVLQTKIITIAITLFIIIPALLFLAKSQNGLYLRITGSDGEVLKAKGVNPLFYRILAWAAAAFFSSIAGIFLAVRVSSFVPGISSGRGWMALAAVYLGKKNPVKIISATLIFCLADFFAAQIQNYLPSLPASVVLALPYIVILIMVSAGKKN